MTIDDLIKYGKDQVRRNSDLMDAYKELFKEKFGRYPNCAGCTFNTDWNRLTSSQKVSVSTFTQNYIDMSNRTFILKDNAIIYSYDVVDRAAKRSKRIRTYGNTMTEEFAIAYLTHGTDEEIEKRKLQFKVLPKLPKSEAPAQEVTEVAAPTEAKPKRVVKKK